MKTFRSWLIENFEPNQFTINNYRDLAIYGDYVMENPRELKNFIKAHMSVLKSLFNLFGKEENEATQRGVRIPQSNNIFAILENSYRDAERIISLPLEDSIGNVIAYLPSRAHSLRQSKEVYPNQPSVVDKIIEYFEFIYELGKNIQLMG